MSIQQETDSFCGCNYRASSGALHQFRDRGSRNVFPTGNLIALFHHGSQLDIDPTVWIDVGSIDVVCNDAGCGKQEKPHCNRSTHRCNHKRRSGGLQSGVDAAVDSVATVQRRSLQITSLTERQLQFLRFKQRKQDHVADGFGAGEQHRKPVHPNTDAAGGGHSVLEREQKVFVNTLLLFAGLFE